VPTIENIEPNISLSTYVIHIKRGLVLDRHEIAISATDFSSIDIDFLEKIKSEIDDSDSGQLTWRGCAFPGHPPPFAGIPVQR
jgi:hypothetical protein